MSVQVLQNGPEQLTARALLRRWGRPEDGHGWRGCAAIAIKDSVQSGQR